MGSPAPEHSAAALLHRYRVAFEISADVRDRRSSGRRGVSRRAAAACHRGSDHPAPGNAREGPLPDDVNSAMAPKPWKTSFPPPEVVVSIDLLKPTPRLLRSVTVSMRGSARAGRASRPRADRRTARRPGLAPAGPLGGRLAGVVQMIRFFGGERLSHVLIRHLPPPKSCVFGVGIRTHCDFQLPGYLHLRGAEVAFARGNKGGRHSDPV